MLAIVACALTQSAGAISRDEFVSETADPQSFCILAAGKAAPIIVDPLENIGVTRAAGDLANDIERVSGVKPRITSALGQIGKAAIIIGTIGRGGIVDQIIREHRIDTNGISGKWEAGLIQVVAGPLPGIDQALLITGSDERGTIYAIYELSEQIGVSPWHWWADVPPRRHASLYVKKGRNVLASPAVKYRGIFINDEGPCLMTWARKKYGDLNHRMYTNMFELILRLKGNYLWPAMWDSSFATDDPLNARLADEYGVIISTSHHEPMMRAWKEWERAGHRKGSWDYSKNAETLQAFWQEGLRRTKDYEKVITIGMRGDGDEPMSETDSISLLERIVADQRGIIRQVMNTNAETVPQVWALYKEVQGYYEKGMRVPDDVTLLWCDDNWGNIRRLPTPAERQRSGGAGIYYHFDYVGGPRNYKWLNTIPLPKVWEQMNLALEYGADRLWIVNVGDLKPLEFPMEFFLSFARDPKRWPKEKIGEFARLWAEREFGSQHAAEIADIMDKYTKYNGRRKPELLEPGTFSLEHYGEADRVVQEWRAITDKAEAIYAELPHEMRDAFFELVLYPTRASAVVNELYIAVAKNRYYAAHSDGRANQFARRARELFEEDIKLAASYNHDLAGGKWNYMMDQTHIGYSGWQQPQTNVMPKVTEVTNEITPDALAAMPGRRTKVPALPKGWSGFVEENGYISIEAEHFTRKVDTAAAHWQVLPDHGRTLSGMTIFPVTTPSIMPPEHSAKLEYQVWLTSTGAVNLTLILSPCLNFAPDRAVRIAVSLDDEPTTVITIVPQNYRAGDGNHDWETAVKDGVRMVTSKQVVQKPGAHLLNIWMVDPAVVVQKLLLDCGGLQPAYLGPPESQFIPRAAER